MKSTTLCYIEKNNQYLMLHRTKKKNDVNEGKYVGVGGHFEGNETPHQCVIREALEETGLTLIKPQYRGIVTFISDKFENEIMHLFTCGEWSGELIECNEGTLKWVDKSRLLDLPMWEGDKIFLKLLEENAPFFELELIYEGEELIEVSLNGKKHKS